MNSTGQIANGANYKVVVFELTRTITPSGAHWRMRWRSMRLNGMAAAITTSANCLQPDGQNDNGWTKDCCS